MRNYQVRKFLLLDGFLAWIMSEISIREEGWFSKSCEKRGRRRFPFWFTNFLPEEKRNLFVFARMNNSKIFQRKKRTEEQCKYSINFKRTFVPRSRTKPICSNIQCMKSVTQRKLDSLQDLPIFFFTAETMNFNSPYSQIIHLSPMFNNMKHTYREGDVHRIRTSYNTSKRIVNIYRDIISMQLISATKLQNPYIYKQIPSNNFFSTLCD